MQAQTPSGLRVKLSLVVPDLNQNWNTQTCFSKTWQYEISYKFFQRFLNCHIEMGQTNMTKLIGEFLRVFVENAPKEGGISQHWLDRA
jgi:hypothetical protein